MSYADKKHRNFKMAGLVLELQRDALDPAVPVDDLLRKAFVVSRKLGLTEMQEWIESELRGYSTVEVPDYRKIYGELKFWNPFNGWIPGFIPDQNLADAIRQRSNLQSVGELSDLLRNDSPTLMVKFSAEQQTQIMRMFNEDLEPVLHLPRQAVVKILDSVRNMVLEWSLDLEAQNILGSGLTFSTEEKQVASQIHYNTVNNIGSMTGSQLQQHSSGQQNMRVDTGGIKSLADAIDAVLNDLKLSNDSKRELQAEIATLRVQIDSPNPKPGIVHSCLTSIKEILQGAAGNIVASGLLIQLSPLLGSTGGS
jgi:hypothetical protein